MTSNSQMDAARANIEAVYGLSSVQEGILFHCIDAEGAGLYLNQFCCTLSGTLVPAVWKSAWELAVRRHTALRTLFSWEGRSRPLQIVRCHVTIPWAYCDIQDVAPHRQPEIIDAFIRDDRCSEFELTTAPLMRLALFRLDATRTRMVWSFHHIILDGWSVMLVIHDILSIYERLCDSAGPVIPAVSRPFKAYVNWLRKQDLAPAQAFWKRVLSGYLPPPSPRYSAAPIRSAESRPVDHFRQSITLSCEHTAAIDEFARERRVTMNTVFQGCWAIIVYLYSGSDSDCVFGTTVSGRSATIKGIESMVGMFLNTLPIRADIDPDKCIIDWLRELQSLQAEINHHAHSPLARIPGWCEIPNNRPLLESIVVFQNQPVDIGFDRTNGRVSLDDITILERSNFPLAVIGYPGASFTFTVVGNPNLVDKDRTSRLTDHLHYLLRMVATDSPTHLIDLLRIPAQQSGCLRQWGQGVESSDSYRCWHTDFEASLPEFAARNALVYGAECITYDVLNRRSNRLARHLKGAGVAPGSHVGIFLERSVEMIVAVLAVHKSGGAYVPLDVRNPRERLRQMIQESNVCAVVTRGKLVTRLPSTNGRTICLDNDADSIRRLPDDNLRIDITAEDLAYVMYTSGSTGQPKGVTITHWNLQNSTRARCDYYQEPIARFLLFPSLSFDSSVAGIFWTLSTGGTLVIPSDDDVMDVMFVGRLISEHRITHLLCVPSFYGQLLAHESESLQSLTTVIVAGETCSPALVQRHFAILNQTALYNEYGPTEATVWTTVYPCKPGFSDCVPIGRPIPRATVRILNQRRIPVPLGVVGELCVGGPGLSPGYWHKPELTEERFIPDPLPGGSPNLLYRTGDLARFLPDGNLEFLGRIDDQVKIHGYRIELDEITATLMRHAAVDEATTVLEQPDDPVQSQMDDGDDWIFELHTMLEALDQNEVEDVLTELEMLSGTDSDIDRHNGWPKNTNTTAATSYSGESGLLPP